VPGVGSVGHPVCGIRLRAQKVADLAESREERREIALDDSLYSKPVDSVIAVHDDIPRL